MTGKAVVNLPFPGADGLFGFSPQTMPGFEIYSRIGLQLAY